VGNLFQTNVKLTEFLLALQIIVLMDVTSHRLIVRYFSDEPPAVFITDEANYTASNPGRDSYHPQISLGVVRRGCLFQGTMCEVLLSCGTPERQGRSPSQGLESRQEDPHLNYRAVLLSGLRTKTANSWLQVLKSRTNFLSFLCNLCHYLHSSQAFRRQ